jgi:hypothetical protein
MARWTTVSNAGDGSTSGGDGKRGVTRRKAVARVAEFEERSVYTTFYRQLRAMRFGMWSEIGEPSSGWGGLIRLRLTPLTTTHRNIPVLTRPGGMTRLTSLGAKAGASSRHVGSAVDG